MGETRDAEVASDLGTSPGFKQTSPNAMTVALLKDAATRAAYVRSEIAALKAAQRAFPPALVSPGPGSPASAATSGASPSPAPANKNKRRDASSGTKGLQTSRSFMEPEAQSRGSPRPAAKLNKSHDSAVQNQRHPALLEQSSLQGEVQVPACTGPRAGKHTRPSTARRKEPGAGSPSGPSRAHTRPRSSAPTLFSGAAHTSPPHTRSEVKAQVLERMKNVNAAMNKISRKKSRSHSARSTRSTEYPAAPAPREAAGMDHSLEHSVLRPISASDANQEKPASCPQHSQGPPLMPPQPASSPPIQDSQEVLQTFVSLSALLHSSSMDGAEPATVTARQAEGKKRRKKKKKPAEEVPARSQETLHRPGRPLSSRGGGGQGLGRSPRGAAGPKQQPRKAPGAPRSAAVQTRAAALKKRPNPSKSKGRSCASAEWSSAASEPGLSPWSTGGTPGSAGGPDADSVNDLLATVDRKLLREGAEASAEHRRRSEQGLDESDPLYTWDPEALALELGRSSDAAAGGPRRVGWKEQARAAELSAASGSPAARGGEALQALALHGGYPEPYPLGDAGAGTPAGHRALPSPGAASLAGSTVPPSVTSDPDPFLVSPASLPAAFRNLRSDPLTSQGNYSYPAPGSIRSKLPEIIDDEDMAAAAAAAAGIAEEAGGDGLAATAARENGDPAAAPGMDMDLAGRARPPRLFTSPSDNHHQGTAVWATVSQVLGESRASLSTLSVDDILREVARGTKMGKRKDEVDPEGSAQPQARASGPTLMRRISSNFSQGSNQGKANAARSTRCVQLVLDRRSAILAYRRGAFRGNNHGYVMSVETVGYPWQADHEISVKTDSFIFHLMPRNPRDYYVWIMGLNIALHYVDGADPDLASPAVDTPLNPRLRTLSASNSLNRWV